MPCFDIAQYFWTVKKKAIPKDVVVSDSSPFFDRNSRCFKARNTRTNLRHGKLSPIVVSVGIVAFAFLETDVKQCRHINGIRDILLLWVPLQHILQLLEKSNFYHCNDWEYLPALLGFLNSSAYLELLFLLIIENNGKLVMT